MAGRSASYYYKEDFILQLGDLDRSATLDQPTPSSLWMEIEDLIPLEICAHAARAYLTEICGADTDTAMLLTDTVIGEALTTGGSTFDAIEACFVNLSDEGWHIEKVGFARLVIEAVHELATQPDLASQNGSSSLLTFENNMRLLFRKLRRMQRDAERELSGDRVSRRVDRAKNSFLRDHPDEAKREQALVLLEEIEAALDSSLESEAVVIGLQRLRRDYRLDVDVTEPIQDYVQFRNRLDSIKYLGRLVTQAPDDQITPRSPVSLPKSVVAVEVSGTE